jgi:hypothetical protein
MDSICGLNRAVLALTGQKSFFSLYPTRGGLGIFGSAMTVDDFRGVLEGPLDGVPVCALRRTVKQGTS